MGSKIKTWFYGGLVSIILCTTIQAGVARNDPQSSLSKIHSSSPSTQSNFIPFENEQTQTLVVEPQLFLDGIGPQCGGTVWTLEVNGDKKTLRCSNQRAIHGEDKIRRALSTLFSKKRPISGGEAHMFAQTGELSNPSGAVLFVVDRATRSANLLSGGSENLRDVFKTQGSFDAWLQNATSSAYSLANFSSQTQGEAEDTQGLAANTLDAINSVVYAPNKVAAVANGLSGAARVLKSAAATPALSHLGKLSGALELAGTHLGTIAGSAAKVLGPVGTALTIAQTIGLDEVAMRIPDLLYPARKNEQAQLVIIIAKLIMVFAKANMPDAGTHPDLKDLADISDGMRFYNVQQGLLPPEWRKNFKKHPQESVEQLALETGKNVCCLVVGSGRFVCPNFFQTLYVYRKDPEFQQPISEVIKSRGLKDDRVTKALGHTCTLEEITHNQTLCLVFEQKSQQIYLIGYEPHGIPQFPNIFTPENWEHWKTVFGSIGERLKDSGELLGISFGKKLRALPVVGNYAADKLGLENELRHVEGIGNTLLTFEKEKTSPSGHPLMIGYEKDNRQSVTYPTVSFGYKEYDNNGERIDNLSDDEFWVFAQDAENNYRLKDSKSDKDLGENWNMQAHGNKEATLYNNHPYDGDEYMEEQPEVCLKNHWISETLLTA